MQNSDKPEARLPVDVSAKRLTLYNLKYMLVVLTTTPDFEEAERLAEAIVNERLAGCVQILPKMTSVYYWEGGVQKEPEHLLLIKSLEEKFEALKAYILENHSYEIPEIVALSSEHVSKSYDGWLRGYLA